MNFKRVFFPESELRLQWQLDLTALTLLPNFGAYKRARNLDPFRDLRRFGVDVWRDLFAVS